MTKAILSFFKFRVVKQRELENYFDFKLKVQQNIKRFYLSVMVDRFIENRTLKSNRFKAKRNFKFIMKSKVFDSWAAVNTNKVNSERMFLRRLL